MTCTGRRKKKRFSERFKSKNAPEKASNNAKPRKTGSRNGRFAGAPFEFITDVSRLTKGRATLLVALAIYRRVKICKNRTVTLPSDELAEWGIIRQYKQEALANLQTVRLIEVANVNGRTARITLLWKLS